MSTSYRRTRRAALDKVNRKNTKGALDRAVAAVGEAAPCLVCGAAGGHAPGCTVGEDLRPETLRAAIINGIVACDFDRDRLSLVAYVEAHVRSFLGFDPAAARAVLDDPRTAAATDMLHVLKRAVELSRLRPHGRIETTCTCVQCRVVQEMHAVIARADGRWEGRTTLARAKAVSRERRKS